MIKFTTSEQITTYTDHEVPFKKFLDEYCDSLVIDAFDSTNGENIILKFYNRVLEDSVLVNCAVSIEVNKEDVPFLEEHIRLGKLTSLCNLEIKNLIDSLNTLYYEHK